MHTNSGESSRLIEQKKVTKEKEDHVFIHGKRNVSRKIALSFCPTDWFGKSKVADYRDVSIKETWSGEFYKDLREQDFCKYQND